MNGMAQNERNPIKQQEQYQTIVEIAEKIINDKKTTTLDKQFSALEILHALYYIIKLKIDQCPDSANYDIDKAKRYINNRSLFGNDSFGHIANTKGLIHLWSGIAKIRMEEKEKAVYYFKESLKYFNEALYINPNKKEFLNHKGVALQQLYDIEPSEKTKLELGNTLELISSLSPQYGKGQLNYASYKVRELRNKLGLKPLKDFPDYQSQIPVEYNFKELYEYALEAKAQIATAKVLCPLMINCDYKMGELITLIIMMKRDNNINCDKDIKEAEEAFKSAASINPEHLSYLYCKYAFLTLRDETKKDAENVKDLINRKKNGN